MEIVLVAVIVAAGLGLAFVAYQSMVAGGAWSIARRVGQQPGVQRAVDFLLDDGTGVALVRAEHGRVTLERDFQPPRTTLDEVQCSTSCSAPGATTTDHRAPSGSTSGRACWRPASGPA